MAKIYLKPGFVNAHDGDRHYVGLEVLRKLYGLSALQARQLNPWDKVKPEDVVLRPSAEGDYNLPEKAKEILNASIQV